MEMSFDQYIANPMGIRNAVYSNKEMYRRLYTEKLDKILVREVGNVKYTLFYDKDNYYILMKVPSEVVENFYYDTVVMFYTNDETVKMERTLKHYNIKFYSNDPSFVYTFAHAMLENDLFIRDLVPRMSKEAVKNVASEKNPKNEIGYVKSIYFTYLLMMNYGLFQKIKFESEGEKYDRKRLLSLVAHADDKVKDRQVKGQEVAEKQRLKKAVETRKKVHSDNNNRSLSHPVDKSTNTAIVKTTSMVKKTSNVKKTSRIKK